MNSFVEICIYEVKVNKTDEFEILLAEISKHHKEFPGVIDVKYMKRTHRPPDFNAVKKAEPAIKLTKKMPTVTYVLYWELNNEITHAKATQSGLNKFFKRFPRCLATIPKIILGECII